MAESMSRLSLRGIPEQTSDIRVSFDICYPCEIEIAPVSLRLTREGVLQVSMALGAL
jgi:hypothetical protein